jgi:hypothetical protein
LDGDTLAITGVSGAAGGTVAIVDGKIVFTPTANFNGIGTFSYTVSDGQGGTATATVTVPVAPVNDAPNAGNDTVAATEDQPLTIDPATLQVNDGDLDGDALTITGITSVRRRVGGDRGRHDRCSRPRPTSMAPAASATRSATATGAPSRRP